MIQRFRASQIADAVAWVGSASASGRACYATFNAVDAAPAGSVRDVDVTASSHLFIDIDCGNPTGTAATDAQRVVAFAVAERVKELLRAFGPPEREVDSGNGAHLYWPSSLSLTDCVKDGPAHELLKRLNAKFAELSTVKVDTTVSNLSRITRIAGTWNVKGDPHRLVTVRATNPDARPVTSELLRDVVDSLPPVPVPVVVKPKNPTHKPKKTTSARNAKSTVTHAPDTAALLTAALNRGDVTINGKKYAFAERRHRAERFIDTLPDEDLSRDGSGTAGKTFLRHLRKCAVDLLIRDRADLVTLGQRYNARLTQAAARHPDRADEFRPWEGFEFEHKIDDALNQFDTDHTPGQMLTRDRADFVPRVWNDPARLAEEYLEANEVRFVKDVAFVFDDAGYTLAEDNAFTARLRRFIEAKADAQHAHESREWTAVNDALAAELTLARGRLNAADKEHAETDVKKLAKQSTAHTKREPKVAPKVSGRDVAELHAALRARRQLPGDQPFNVWLSNSNRPRVLAVANGLLDPVARMLSPASSDWFSVVTLPVAFDPAAPPPAKWLAFLNEVMEGDTDRIAVLQEIAGGCLDLDPAKWFAMLVGGGDNGKSVFLVVLRAVLGLGNISALTLDSLTSDKHALWGMFGKLANIVGDQGYVESADEGRLKMLTGGDPVTFNPKNRDTITAEITTKIVFSSNNPPTFGDKSDAVWNRLVAVPFTYTVPVDKKNPAMLMADYWRDELPGVLNWMLDGLARWKRLRGFTKSTACEALGTKHRVDSNPARLFLMEYEFTGDASHRVAASELYDKYTLWRTGNGFTRALTKPKFDDEVKRAYPGVPVDANGYPKAVKVNGKAVRVWVGIRVREFQE